MNAINGENELIAIAMVEDNHPILDRTQMTAVAVGRLAGNFNRPFTEERRRRWYSDAGKL